MMLFSSKSLLAVSFLLISTFAATFTPLLPPSYPLAVRNPYLSAWLPGMNVSSDITTAQPTFWFGNPLNLTVLAYIDGTVYTLFGAPFGVPRTTKATLNSANYSSTHTFFNLQAGHATVSLDFFSPVSPSNYIRQSLPFSYLTVSLAGVKNDSLVYVQTDDTWTGSTTGNHTANFTVAGNTAIFQVSNVGAMEYTESANMMALWGTFVFAVEFDQRGFTSYMGQSSQLHNNFANSPSSSAGANSSNYRNGDAFALISHTGTSNVPAQFVLGYVRDNEVNYLGNGRAGYYTSQYTTTTSAVQAFVADYGSALAESKSLDASVISKGVASFNSNYSDILSLSMRQTYGAIDLTIPSSNRNTSDVLVFLKEISSDGNVNTVDVLFPTFPVWWSMDAEYIRLAIQPVINYLATGQWPYPYVIHDIGSSYPNATGHNDGMDEMQPVEETGNLLILAAAYVKASGNTAWAKQWTPLLQKYANYLVNNNTGLYITSQLSSDDFAGPSPNQTNLAIKSAIGLNAFGVMSGLKNYSTTGLSWANILYNQKLGTDPQQTHFTFEYGNSSSWIIPYNLYPDILLGLNTFPKAAYQMESTFLPTVRSVDGVALSSYLNNAKTDWDHFFAAVSTTQTCKATLINDVHNFIAEDLPTNQVPFSDNVFVSGATPGGYNGFLARPVVGGHFAVLALGGPNTLQG